MNTPAQVEANADRPGWVVFDFDGVLASRDTMTHFVRTELFAHPSRLILAAPVALIRQLLKCSFHHRSWTARLLVRIAMAGLSTAEYVTLAQQAGREMARTPRFPVSQGFQALEQHLARGGPAIVATGCETHVARSFLREVGVDNVTVVTSSFDPRRGSIGLHHYSIGAQKLEDVQNLVGDLSDCQLYTDSLDDLPLARAVRHTHLINPNRRTRHRYARLVPSYSIHLWPPGHS